MAFIFGSGIMFGVPNSTNPTPRQFGTLQEVSVDLSGSIKELNGQFQFASAVARGTQKITGKAKAANINIDMYNALYFGETLEVGQNLVEYNGEYKTESTAATVTVKGGTFLRDLGVLNSKGEVFTRVASDATPKTNEYKLDESTGLYTFSEDNKGKMVYISHMYHDDTGGHMITINNQLMGEATGFTAIFNGRFGGKQTTLILENCISSKLTLLGTKTEDFTIPEFDFSASVNAVGKVGSLSSSD